MLNIVRKSTDGKVMMLALSAGYTVRVRAPRWNQTNSHLGIQTLDWECKGKGMTRADADRLFDSLAA